jgi:predicted phage terminase large subunit-like protein
MDFIIAALDTAYTTKQENDFSAMTVWGVFSRDIVSQPTKQLSRDGVLVDVLVPENDGSFSTRQLEVDRFYGDHHAKVILIDAWQEKLELHDLVNKVAKTMKTLKVDKLLIENKAAGYSVAQELRRLYSHENWAVQMDDPKSTDKLARLYSVQHLFAEGLIFAPDKEWSRTVIDQVAAFPKAKHDDLVDTVSMAIRHLRQIGLLQRKNEAESYKDTPQPYNNNIEPLYPV